MTTISMDDFFVVEGKQSSLPAGEETDVSGEVVIEPEIREKLQSRILRVEVNRIQLLRCAMKGMDAVQAAAVVGLHPQTVRSYYEDPSFREAVRMKVDLALGGVDKAYAKRRKTLHEMIDEQAERSFVDLVTMLEDPELPAHHRIKINQDFLNRSAESMQKTAIAHAKLDPEQLLAAAKAANEMDKRVIPFRKTGTGD